MEEKLVLTFLDWNQIVYLDKIIFMNFIQKFQIT